MNTWLPDSDFIRSAEILDTKRLDRQRADVLNILKACCEPKPEQQREHPAITMWRGSEQVLIQYGAAICLEWRSRGNSDTLLAKILPYSEFFSEGDIQPEWLGDNPFHTSHQSYLMRLMPSWYSQFFTVRDDLPLIWPRQEPKISEERLEREKVRARKRAQRAKVKAEIATKEARRIAILAGFHPDTLAELSESEKINFELEMEADDATTENSTKTV